MRPDDRGGTVHPRRRPLYRRRHGPQRVARRVTERRACEYPISASDNRVVDCPRTPAPWHHRGPPTGTPIAAANVVRAPTRRSALVRHWTTHRRRPSIRPPWRVHRIATPNDATLPARAPISASRSRSRRFDIGARVAVVGVARRRRSTTDARSCTRGLGVTGSKLAGINDCGPPRPLGLGRRP